jgi:aminoglycoside 3'-phosphotransferase-1
MSKRGGAAMSREKNCGAVDVPASLSVALAGYAWARNTVGESGGAVYRLHGKPGAPDLYLKHGKHRVADDIDAEAARLRWLAEYLPVPRVVQFERASHEAWLLMTAIPGLSAYQVMEAHPESRSAVVDALAAFLRRLHAISPAACPFTSDLAQRLSLARARIDAGLVDADDFDEEREGWSAQQVWDAMQALPPLDPDPVVSHGDYSLDNLLLRDGEVVGCIDAGRVGVADRYRDLAIMWNCLGEFGAPLQERFMRSYGIADIDQGKLTLHLLLDELF